jgi:hypothetical protein
VDHAASTHEGRLAFKPRVAGSLAVRVIATGNGVDEVSDSERLVVQFPTFAEIVAEVGRNAGVIPNVTSGEGKSIKSTDLLDISI